MDPERAQYARTIGRRIQRLRDFRGKTLEVIAGLAGISKSKLHRIENGETALDKLSDIVALAGALEVSPSDLMRLPIPAPANGHTDITIEAIGHALDAIDAEQPDGVGLPVAVLHEQVIRIVDQVRACRFGEVATDLPGLIANLHTTLATNGADHAELLELAVRLHVHVTWRWLESAGAHTHLQRRVVFLALRLARERDEVITLAMAGYGVAGVLLRGGSFRRGRAVLESITLPVVTRDTARLVARPSRERRPAGRSPHPPLPGEPECSYWVNIGRALSKLPGRQDDAVRALLTAEQLFPTRVLRHQGVREALGEMLARSRYGVTGAELRGMAYRAGLLPEPV